MRAIYQSLTGFMAGAVLSVLVAAPGAAQETRPMGGFADLAARLLPSVVNVSTSQTVKLDPKARPDLPQFPPGSPFEEFFKDFLDRQGRGAQDDKAPQSHKTQSLGSGFIIDATGLIVTNNHVIADADEITVILSDDTNLKADLVGRDVKTDLALLRVKSDHSLPAVAFGDSDKARVGDWVLAIGNPYGLGGTVTAGIVSARSREINNNGPYDDFLQTDASINRGNSGGPLFNMAGEVIGINSAIFSPSGGSIGIGFAIPSTLARTIIGQLRDFGHARRGWIGVRIQGVNEEIAEGLGLGKPRGVLVGGVTATGPAAKAGLQGGDIVLGIDGKEVPDIRHFQRLIAEAPIDKLVKLTLWRKKSQTTIEVKIGELDETEPVTPAGPKPEKHDGPPAAKVDVLGLTLAEASPELKEKYQLTETGGVVVTEITRGTPLAGKDVKPGDVIVEIGQEEVKHPDDVLRKVAEAKKAGKHSVLLLVDRAGDLHFLTLRVDQG